MPDVPSAQADLAQNAILATSTNYYLSLHTADPGTSGSSEGTDGRQAIQFAASSGGSQASNTSQLWASAVGGQTYTYFGVWTASSGGTYKRGGSLNSAIVPPAAAQITVASGAIILTAS
jgi:hypothetical protein